MDYLLEQSPSLILVYTIMDIGDVFRVIGLLLLGALGLWILYAIGGWVLSTFGIVGLVIFMAFIL